MSPALEGRFFTTGPRGKSQQIGFISSANSNQLVQLSATLEKNDLRPEAMLGSNCDPLLMSAWK